MRGLSTLRVRLIAMLTAVVAVAMGVVFLYVVPSLRDQLIARRFDRLEAVARAEQHSQALRNPPRDRTAPATALNRIRRLANARVDVFVIRDGRAVTEGPDDIPAVSPGNVAVKKAVRGEPVVRARDKRGDLVVAFSMPGDHVVALSQQVRDINTTA